MKGGVQRMLHIGVKYGMVVYVYKLGKTPDEPVIPLQEEFDYKVDYLDRKGKKVKFVFDKNGWLIPLYPKRKKGHKPPYARCARIL